MPTFDPVAFGVRLRSDMEKRGFDVKGLREKVENEVIRKTGNKCGTSYGTIWSYVNGQAPLEPRREVVEALAEVLSPKRNHLLPHFLMFGEGPKTEREAEALRLQQSETEDRTNYEPYREAFREGLPYDHLGNVARGQLWRLWLAFLDLERDRRELARNAVTDDDEHEVGVEVARLIAVSLRQPLDDLRLISRKTDLGIESELQLIGEIMGDLDSYIIQACEGLLTLVRKRQEWITPYLARRGESQPSSTEPKEDEDDQA